MKVGEVVDYIASTFSFPVEKQSAIETAGIGSLLGRTVKKCSGGEQQRLKFALALLTKPDVLILDEPTAGMDVGARRTFWEAMKAEALAGRTVIFATHYLEEADEFAQRIVLMHEGRVIADGPTSEIRSLTGIRHVSMRILENDAGWRGSLDSVGLDYVVDAGVLKVTTSDSDGVARHLLGLPGLADLEIIPSRLDDTFVQLTSTRGDAAS